MLGCYFFFRLAITFSAINVIRRVLFCQKIIAVSLLLVQLASDQNPDMQDALSPLASVCAQFSVSSSVSVRHPVTVVVSV